MRRITRGQMGLFSVQLAAAVTLGVGTTSLALGGLPLGDFRGVLLLLAAILATYGWAMAIYRLFLRLLPLQEGELAPGSRAELAAQVNILYYLILFNSIIRTHFVPVPLMRLVYLALGARLGENTYSAGTLLDPPLTEVGANTLIGHDAVVFCHAIEGDRFSLGRVRIGSDVTIGTSAVIMSNVVIGDGAIVSAGAVVPKGTCIGPGELWGGVPARPLRGAGERGPTPMHGTGPLAPHAVSAQRGPQAGRTAPSGEPTASVVGHLYRETKAGDRDMSAGDGARTQTPGERIASGTPCQRTGGGGADSAVPGGGNGGG